MASVAAITAARLFCACISHGCSSRLAVASFGVVGRGSGEKGSAAGTGFRSSNTRIAGMVRRKIGDVGRPGSVGWADQRGTGHRVERTNEARGGWAWTRIVDRADDAVDGSIGCQDAHVAKGRDVWKLERACDVVNASACVLCSSGMDRLAASACGPSRWCDSAAVAGYGGGGVGGCW